MYTPVRFALCLSCFVFMCVCVVFCYVTLYLGEAKLYVRSCMFTDPVEDRNRRTKGQDWPRCIGQKERNTRKEHMCTHLFGSRSACLVLYLCVCVCVCGFCYVTLYLGEAKLYVRSCMFTDPSRIGIEGRKDKTGQDALARKSGIHGKSTCVHTCSVRALFCLALPRCVVFCWPCTEVGRSCMFKVVRSQIRSKIGMEECWP